MMANAVEGSRSGEGVVPAALGNEKIGCCAVGGALALGAWAPHP